MGMGMPHFLGTGTRHPTRKSFDCRTVCRSARDPSRDSKQSTRRRRSAEVPRTSDTIVRTLDVAETVVLGAATAAGVKVALDSSGRRPVTRQDRGVDASSAASTSNATTTLSSLVLVSLILRKVSSRVVEQKRQASPTSQAMQRLQNVEVAVEREGRVLEGALRDMDGLKMRSRLIGREVKEVRKVVDGVELGYGEMGRVIEVQMGEMQGQVSDLEGLTSSIHGVMAKQVGLISGVVTKVRGLERDVVVLKGEMGEAEAGIEVSEEPQQQNQAQEEMERKQERELVVRQEVVTREKDGSVLYTWDSS